MLRLVQQGRGLRHLAALGEKAGDAGGHHDCVDRVRHTLANHEGAPKRCFGLGTAPLSGAHSPKGIERLRLSAMIIRESELHRQAG